MADVIDIQFTMPDGRTVKAGAMGEEFKRRFGNIEKYLNSSEWYKDAAPEIFKTLEGAMSERFKAEGAAFGGDEWRANSPEWVDIKQALTGQSKVGEFTGAMRKSLTISEAPKAIRRVLDKSIEYGTSVPYAADFAEFRPLFVFDNTVRNGFLRAFHRAAVNKANEQLKAGGVSNGTN